MARMIPSLIGSDIASTGEKEIFRLLRDDPITKDWSSHSLDIALHSRQVSGEAILW